MIPNQIKILIQRLAENNIKHIVGLQSTQSIVMQQQQKFDKLQIKLRKEAEKINKREENDDVKLENQHRRKGAITYRSYTIQFKKKLISSIREEFQMGREPLSKIIRHHARLHQIHPKNITRWYHTKELKKKEGGRRALYPQMELKLALFILRNPTMKRKHILKQAKQILEDLNIEGRQYFNFSKGWYERFRDRYTKRKMFKDNIKFEDVKFEESNIKYEDVKYEDFFGGDEVKVEYDENVKVEYDEDVKVEYYDDVKIEEFDEKFEASMSATSCEEQFD